MNRTFGWEVSTGEMKVTQRNILLGGWILLVHERGKEKERKSTSHVGNLNLEIVDNFCDQGSKSTNFFFRRSRFLHQ